MIKKQHSILLALLATFFFSSSLKSQDTLRVQTFTWDSDTRSEFFQFPDDPNLNFRKIWMRYNMRCHDNAVGNGNVGCYEWDYSCNTFVYDPSRVDSTRETHPTHIISNFSGAVFEYTAQPTYTYVQYQQHDPTVTIANEVAGTVGTGSETLVLSGTQKTGRAQYLYTAAELTGAGLSAGAIHAVEVDPLQNGQVGFLRIRLKPTAKTELDANSPDLDGFTEVYFLNTDILPGGPQRFDFYQPFDWDGSSNMLVDLSFTFEPTGTTPAIQASDTPFNSAIFSGLEDYSLHFAGAGNVEVPAEKFATVSDEITVSLWCYGLPETMPTNSAILEGLDAANQRQLNVHLPWGNGQVYWDCGNDGSGYDRINKAANEADFEGQWNHWAFNKNANTGEMKIYLNGQLWHSGTGLTKLIDVASFTLASSVNGNLHYFGNVDEFQVWDKALDQATIQAWMRRPITPSHPFYGNLVAYFTLDEGSGNVATDIVGNGLNAAINLTDWKLVRGKDLYKNFTSSTTRPNITFVQGDADVQDVAVAVLDSFLNPQHSVTHYGLDGTDLIVLDEQYFYQAGYTYVVDENGEVLDSVLIAPEGSIEPGQLTHYTKANAKYELLSLVTPYGNGLSLGADGKTFIFDVTDYAPILKGEKRISIEMGGQFQEELDIEFLFITGTPPREVQNIQQIWPFRRGNYDQVQSDRYFEPRQVQLSPDGHQFKLRSAITGHGQNGEFIPRTHYLNINGGAQEFTYQVWKECADNPIYPQGGTWIFDRAGWCPGAATDVHEFDITDMVTPGGTVEIDYGVNGANLTEANYLVNNQMVTYGDWNFNLDASLERIARPNATDVEFERINPVCSNPLVWVKNTGATAINSLSFEYWVNGGSEVKTFDWNGTIQPDELTEIKLPVESVSFWQTALTAKIFEAKITQVNGMADGYADNNAASSTFKLAKVFDGDKEYELYVRTNNNGGQNSYTLKNAAGVVVLERNNMAANTTFQDALDLAPGCYTLEFFDTGDDGLEFWYFPSNGVGSLKINRLLNGNGITAQSFDPDFGKGIVFSFVMDGLVGTEQKVRNQVFSVFPNPASDAVMVELQGFENEAVTIGLCDLQGRTVLEENRVALPSGMWQEKVGLQHLPAGLYFMKVKSGDKVWTRKVVKQ
ncbi:MAG: T9SS type A sorting domain-containing protein [Lewinellaceae bacterium]|nr:T9SS type A sorting domain-containing protein [Lewinellaceae bacterium]